MRIHLLCIHKRISCVYTRDLLCMHNTLVHALGQGTQGPGPKKGAWAGPRPGPALVYTQEILLCIHNKSILILSYDIIIVFYFMLILLNNYIIIFSYHIIILSYYHMIIIILLYYYIIIFLYYSYIIL